MGKELSGTERQILKYIYRAFRDEGRWVESRHLVHDLQAPGVDVYEVAKGIGWWLVRMEDPDKEDALAKLTVEGVAACEGSQQDLSDFLSVLQLFVRTYRETRDGVPQVTTDDCVRELNLSELQARKIALLLLEGSGLWQSASRVGKAGLASFKLSRKILDFEMVDSIEDYLEIRKRDRPERSAISSGSPVSAGPTDESVTIDEIRSSLNGLPFLKATTAHLLADFEETAKAYQNGAYKACVVMCGAVMEGLLLGNLERARNIKLLWDAGRLTDFETYGDVRNKLRQTSLEDLINHTRKSSCIDGFTDEMAKMVQRCRNSVHPGRVLRGDEVFDAFDRRVADLALSFLNVLCSLMAKR